MAQALYKICQRKDAVKFGIPAFAFRKFIWESTRSKVRSRRLGPLSIVVTLSSDAVSMRDKRQRGQSTHRRLHTVDSLHVALAPWFPKPRGV